MTVILMSIRPQHLVNVLNGKKTRELRIRIPKGFKGWIYFYCTKGKPYLYKNKGIWFVSYENLNTPLLDIDFKHNGKVVCRFWFDDYDKYILEPLELSKNRYVHDIEEYDISYEDLEKLCLDYRQVEGYGKGKDLYTLHINQLEIFDEPKSLTEFKKWTKKIIYSGMDCPPYADDVLVPVTKAPQSWQYIEVKE